jgi:ferricrocin synthase
MGMRLCAASNDLLFRDIELVINLMNITHLSLTPSVAALIKPTNVPNVLMLVTAGEAVTSKVFHDWSGRGLYQGYGPSETTNICSVHCKVSASDHANNIGKPLPNSSMFISSSDTFRPLPKGALGEIWIGGDQVGQGYLNDVDLTAEKFVNHPEYGRLYRSGDFGRMLPSGVILFHGRQDDQVKLRGQRIELGEIEHALVQMPMVTDSVCLLIEGSEPSQDRLVAYMSLTMDSNPDPTHYISPIFDELHSELPAYMIPDYLIYVDGIPLTSQGKTDRQALKQRFLDAKPAELNIFSRQGDVCMDSHFDQPDEIKVAQAVAFVTGAALSLISRNTSFFALGLDSINCIGLCRKLLEAGFGHVDASVVLRHASVAKLATRLLAIQHNDSIKKGVQSKLQHIFEEDWQQSVKLKYARKGLLVSKILPCTPLQQAMLSQAEGDSKGAYQNQLTFSVLGDLPRLRTAWSTCIATHEILRTGFILTTSSQFAYAQIVLADFGSPWNNEKRAAGDSADEEQFMMPPYSLYVEKQSKTLQSRIILKIHHALYDGQALSLLLQDVQRAYQNSPIGAAVSLEPYLQYMVGLHEGEADEFWRAHLANYQPKLLLRPSMERESEFRSEEVLCHSSCKISPQVLAESGKQSSVTALSLLQSTWVRLLTHYSNDLDICFGNVYSGRNLPVRDVEKIVGPCFNTLPVRTKVGKHETNQHVARKLQTHNLAALRFQPSSYHLIQRNQGGTRLFDTLVLLQAESVPLDSSIWTLVEDSGYMKFPLILEITPNTRLSTLDLLLHVEPGLLSGGEAQAVLRDFEILLEHTIRYPSALAIDCSMLGNGKPLSLTSSSATEIIVTAANLSKGHVAEEWSPSESFVCAVLRKVSGRDFCGLTRHTTIFHLGFDSISAIQIAAALRKEGYRLTSGDVLEAATVPKIASICKQQEPEKLYDNELFDFDSFSKNHVPEVCHRLFIDPETIEEIRPCTPFQCGVLADFVRSQGRYYLNSVMYELVDCVDIRLLRRAWELISSRHDILRTGFVSIDDIQSPFAMILYSSGSSPLPWWESGAAFVQNDAEYRLSVLDSLHKPPWRLSIENRGTQMVMHLSMLHAIYDARSLELLLAEVAAAYRSEQLPRAVPIKPCLSRILLKSSNQPTYNASASGVDAMPSTKFPNLHSHHLQDPDFCTIEHECSYRLRRLQASCRKTGVTLQVAGQCAFARLLSSYTGETVNTFGVVMSGRSGENEDEAVVFPCINTTPVSLKAESVTNKKLLETAGKCNAILLKNPFASQRVFSSAQRELFDSLFVFQNPLLARTSSPWKVLAEDARANYNVSIELITICDDDKLHFRLTFRKQVIPVEQVNLLLEQLDSLLVDTLEHPDDEASRFVYTAKDLVSIAPANDSTIDTQVKCLHQFVEISAQKLPKKVALEFAVGIKDEKVKKLSWTYMELNADSNKIAHILQRNGAMPGDVVGFCFDKCPEASLTMLGILKAGCAYVALDPNAPESRKRFILKDSGCRILCSTQDKAVSLALVDNLQFLCVDRLLNESDWPCTTVALPRKLVAADVCYCLYTSGTTGTPKGCLITHGNTVQFILAFQRLFAGHWDEDSRFLQFASFHFDVSVMEQFWSWSVGICVTSASRDLLFEDLPAAIRALRITHLDLTPSLARLLTPEECPSLRQGAFITGGEQLRQDIIDAWGKDRVIYNGYGPSEVTIGCTMYPRIPVSAKPSNIGRPYDNVGAYVLGTHTKSPVLKGGIGELCVSGPLVGKGYLNRPELTAEKFEYLDQLQVRVYHTGDLVRLLYDGSFVFVGRADDQVKLRGQRIEIGEINHIICKTSQTIKEVTTMLLKYREESKEQLVSFIASSDSQPHAEHAVIDSSPGVSSLIHRTRKACSGALPAYMVPTYIIPVTSMPLSANNKVDNKSLQRLFEATTATVLQQLSAHDASSLNTNSEVMKKVIQIVSKTIRLSEDTVRASSHLFELGFDSISVILLSRSLKRAGFQAASPSKIMQNSVLADLVTAMTESEHDLKTEKISHQEAKQDIASFARRHRPAAAASLGRSLHDIQLVAPCTALQQGMIARTLNSADAVYFSSFTFALGMSLNAARLEAAWLEVERENEILRTAFLLTEDGYAQVVLTTTSSPSTRVQQSVIACEDEWEDVIKHDFMRWSERSGSLENELWGVAIYHTPKETLMTLHIFHALYDGISLARMLEEVACKYTGQSCVYPKPTFHDILPFGPLLSPAGSQNFWEDNLVAINLLDLPRKRDADDAIIISSDVMPSENAQKVQLQLNVTEAAVLQACWLISLEKKFKILPTVGIVVSGRNIDIDGIENTIGPLFNTVPCQIEKQAMTTIADFVKACHSFNVKAIPYQQTPLSSISKWLGRKSTQPLFDSLFVFQKETGDITESRKLWTQIDSKSQPDYPLALEVEQKINGSLACNIVVLRQYLCREEVQELLDILKDTIMDVFKDPHQSLTFQNHETCQLPASNDSKSQSGGTFGGKQIANNSGVGKNDFQWDATSVLIRSEIAKLSASEIEDVTPFTSLFELGLDSLDAIKLCAKLRAATIFISVTSILQAGTIARMVQKTSGAKGHLGDRTCPSFERVKEDLRRSLRDQGVPVDDYEKVLPVTPLQESMLANYQHYYGQDVLRVLNEVDVEKLASAWRSVASTHDILRTSFVEVVDPKSSSTYAQLVSRDFNFECTFITCSSEIELQDLLASRRAEAGSKGINDTAFHLTFVRVGSNTFLIIGMPHALYDGWSINLLHEDVVRCYSELQYQRPSYEPILDHILAAVSEKSRSFWKKRLSDLRPKTFPSLPAEEVVKATTYRHEISSKLPANRATSFCKTNGVTLQSLGLTCWALVLAHYLESRDICFGVVLAGRSIEAADRMMFPTINTVPFRIVLEENKLEMVRYVQKLSIEIAEYQHFPLRQAKLMVDCSISQLFDTLFVYQKRPLQSEQLKPLYKSVGGLSDPEYPVNIEMELLHDKLVWRAACNEPFLNGKGTQELLGRVDDVLLSIVEALPEPAFSSHSTGISICGLPTFSNWTDGGFLESRLTTMSKDTDVDQFRPLPNEEVISEVLAEVANTERREITRSTSLFHLGLDSISAIKVSYALKSRSISLPVSEMLKALTVQNMAKAAKPFATMEDRKPAKKGEGNVQLLDQAWVQDSLEPAGVQKYQIESISPCTAGQVFFLRVWQASGGRLFYPAFHYQIQGPSMDQQTIDTAWQRLTQAVPMLRTTFLPATVRNTSFFQVTLKNTVNPVVWIREGNEESKDNDSASQHDARPPAMLLATRTATAVLLRLQIHHALYDGVSLPGIMNAFKSFCYSPCPPAELETDFQGYLNYLHHSTAKKQQKTFWTSYLNGSHVPQSRCATSFETERIQLFQTKLIDDLSLIEKQLNRSGISFQALFFAAYAFVHIRSVFHYARTSEGITELTLGVYLANRSHDHKGLSRLLAPTVNVVPLRIAVRPESSLLESARAVQDDLLKVGSLENCTVSLSEIHEWMGVKIDCFVNFLKLPDMERSFVPVENDVTMQEIELDNRLPHEKAKREPPSPFAHGVPVQVDNVYLVRLPLYTNGEFTDTVIAVDRH